MIQALVRGDGVHRAAYGDPAVFALEEERIFRRAWLYVAHESEVLLGVPLAEGYAEDARLPGLAPVPRVESYRGFVFASHSAQGQGLAEFLGGLASAFDNLLDRAPAGTVTRFGGALRLEYRGNWKMFMENAVDLAHPNSVHRSAVDAARAEPEAADADAITEQGAQMFLANGMKATQWSEVPLHAFPGGHVYMGGFYRQGSIAPEREDPVF